MSEIELPEMKSFVEDSFQLFKNNNNFNHMFINSKLSFLNNILDEDDPIRSFDDMEIIFNKIQQCFEFYGETVKYFDDNKYSDDFKKLFLKAFGNILGFQGVRLPISRLFDFFEKKEHTVVEFIGFINTSSFFIKKSYEVDVYLSNTLEKFHKKLSEYLSGYIKSESLLDPHLNRDEFLLKLRLFEKLISCVNEFDHTKELVKNNSRNHYSNCLFENKASGTYSQDYFFRECLFCSMKENLEFITYNTLAGTLSLFLGHELVNNDKILMMDDILERFNFSVENVFSFLLEPKNNDPFIHYKGANNYQIFDKVLLKLDEHDIWNEYSRLLPNNDNSPFIKNEILKFQLDEIIWSMSASRSSNKDNPKHQLFFDVLRRHNIQLDDNIFSNTNISRLDNMSIEKLDLLSENFNNINLELMIKYLFVIESNPSSNSSNIGIFTETSLKSIIDKKLNTMNNVNHDEIFHHVFNKYNFKHKSSFFKQKNKPSLLMNK